MPITWRNVNSRDSRTGAALLDGAGRSLDAANSQFERVFDRRRQTEDANRDNEIANNTASFRDFIQGFGSQEELDQARQSGAIDAERAQFGHLLDRDATRGLAENRLDTLQGREHAAEDRQHTVDERGRALEDRDRRIEQEELSTEQTRLRMGLDAAQGEREAQRFTDNQEDRARDTAEREALAAGERLLAESVQGVTDERHNAYNGMLEFAEEHDIPVNPETGTLELSALDPARQRELRPLVEEAEFSQQLSTTQQREELLRMLRTPIEEGGHGFNEAQAQMAKEQYDHSTTQSPLSADDEGTLFNQEESIRADVQKKEDRLTAEYERDLENNPYAATINDPYADVVDVTEFIRDESFNPVMRNASRRDIVAMVGDALSSGIEMEHPDGTIERIKPPKSMVQAVLSTVQDKDIGIANFLEHNLRREMQREGFFEDYQRGKELQVNYERDLDALHQGRDVAITRANMAARNDVGAVPEEGNALLRRLDRGIERSQQRWAGEAAQQWQDNTPRGLTGRGQAPDRREVAQRFRDPNPRVTPLPRDEPINRTPSHQGRTRGFGD